MITITKEQGYENLANAIILQAIKDYKQGYQQKEVVSFLRSQWYNELTGVPASAIMKICKNKDVKASFKW